MQSSVRCGDTDILKQQALQVAAHPYAEPQRSGEVLQRYAKGICYILQYHGGSDGAVVNQSERPQLVMQQQSLYLLYVHLRVCKVYLCVRQAQRVLYEIHVSAHVLYIEVALLLKERQFVDRCRESAAVYLVDIGVNTHHNGDVSGVKPSAVRLALVLSRQVVVILISQGVYRDLYVMYSRRGISPLRLVPYHRLVKIEMHIGVQLVDLGIPQGVALCRVFLEVTAQSGREVLELNV